MSAWSNGNPLQTGSRDEQGSNFPGLNSGLRGLNVNNNGGGSNKNDGGQSGNSSRLSSWTVPGGNGNDPSSVDARQQQQGGAGRSQTAPPGLGDYGNMSSMQQFGMYNNNSLNNNGFNESQQGWGQQSTTSSFYQPMNGGIDPAQQRNDGGGSNLLMGNNPQMNFGANGMGNFYPQQQQQQQQHGSSMGNAGYNSNMMGNFFQQQVQQQNTGAGANKHFGMPQMSQQRSDGGDESTRRMQQIQQQALMWMQQQMESQGLAGNMGNFPQNNGFSAAPSTALNQPPGLPVPGEDRAKGPGGRDARRNGGSPSQGGDLSSNSNSEKSARRSPVAAVEEKKPKQGSMRRFADVAASPSQDGSKNPNNKPATWPTIRAANPVQPVKVKSTPAPAVEPRTNQVPPSVTRSSSSDGRSRTEAKYYQVEFRAPRRDIFVGYDEHFKIGDLVKVEADRGEDLGTLIHIWSAEGFADWLSKNQGGNNRASSSKYHKRMLRLATEDEVKKMTSKIQEEDAALEVCRTKAEQRKLPMKVVSAEYQFDRHKLTFYFEADRRIDFRELVRDLFALYKTRIWLQQMSAVAMPSAAPKSAGQRLRKQ
jgi:hypothetical protein